MGARRWSDRDDGRLVDLIYDAAFDDALWRPVLECLGDRAGAQPANLLQIDVTDGSGFGITARVPEDTAARFFDGWTHLNPIGLVDDPFDYRRDWAPRITRDSDCIDRGALERSTYWNEFLTPLGAGHSIALRLALRDNDLTSIGLGRPAHLGAFEDDDIAALAPFHRHLIRAERMWRSLGLRQAELDQIDALVARSPDALFFLDDRLRLVRWTGAAESLLKTDGALRAVGRRLRATQGAADRALQWALEAALRGGAPPPVAMPAGRSAPASTVSIARLGERASAGVTAARCLMVVVRPQAAIDPASALRTDYGLTGAESDLALALSAGESLRAVAAKRAVSINTVRNQLGAVFDKTGCRRQQDLIRLLTTSRYAPAARA